MNLFEGSGLVFIIGLCICGICWGAIGVIIWVVLSFLGYCLSD